MKKIDKDILNLMNSGIGNAPKLADKLNRRSTTINRRLRSLEKFDYIKHIGYSNNKKGRPAYLWELTPKGNRKVGDINE